MNGCVELENHSRQKLNWCLHTEIGKTIPTHLIFSFLLTYHKTKLTRHDCWGIVVMAGCGANLKFYMFSCISGGSTNDSLAWEISELFRLVEIEKKLANRYYIFSDEAVTTTDQVLSPWPGRGLGPWKDSFNFHLSRMRQCIERAFGRLTQRWGVVWRPLRCSFDKWPLVCSVAAKLHNFCIDEDESVIEQRHADDYEIGNSPEVVMNDYTDDPDDETNYHPNERRRAGGNRREELTRHIESQGVRRPNYSAFTRA